LLRQPEADETECPKGQATVAWSDCKGLPLVGIESPPARDRDRSSPIQVKLRSRREKTAVPSISPEIGEFQSSSMPFLQFKVGFTDPQGKVKQMETPVPPGKGEKR
jgi:hypothetical protein